MQRTSARSVPALVALAVLAFGAPAAAQKMGRGWYEDPFNGYKLKLLKDWNPVPLQPGQQGGELINRIGARILTRFDQGHVQELPVDLLVFRFEDRANDDEDGASDERSKSKKIVRTDVVTVVDEYVRGLRGFDASKPTVDEKVSVRGTMDNKAHHRLFEVRGSYCEMLVDTWQFRYSGVDFGLVYTIPKEHDDYIRYFERCAKTFKRTEEEEARKLGKDASYEDMLAFYEQEVQSTPGWRAEPTPSEAYIILTSSDNDKFIDEIVDRLEASRELYIRDFPPKKESDHVSIVRVCATEEEFHKYGGTGGGVAGWFNPRSTELVLYDAKNINRNQSYAVMSHEAFHQYCHFLFDESEAHRWFDEGHGDYYGGVEFKRGRAEITAHMPGGLDRYQFAKRLVRDETYVPIAKHINFSHGEWQRRGLDSYAQSWSIIYYLRQGSLGDVKSKVWEDEYAEIIPNYVQTLYEGYQALYAEMDAQAAEAQDAGVGGLIGDDDDDGGRRMVMPDKKQEIWERAIAASWGQIDLDEFEANWLQFVDDYL